MDPWAALTETGGGKLGDYQIVRGELQRVYARVADSGYESSSATPVIEAVEESPDEKPTEVSAEEQLTSSAVPEKDNEPATAEVARATPEKLIPSGGIEAATSGQSPAGFAVSSSAPAEEDAATESSYETDTEDENEVFNHANPELEYANVRLQRREARTDPWGKILTWVIDVINEKLEAENAVSPKIKALLPPEGLRIDGMECDQLSDGKILCALIMAIKPAALPKALGSAIARIAQVVKAIQELGVHKNDLFAPPDLMPAPPRNPDVVLRCLVALAGTVQKWPAWKGPRVDDAVARRPSTGR